MCTSECVRILVAQLQDLHLGHIEHNVQCLLALLSQAKRDQVQLIIAPEMALCAYPPGDFLLDIDFIHQCWQALQSLAQQVPEEIVFLVGFPYWHPEQKKLFNAVAVLNQGKIGQIYCKQALADYDVFSESRYFSSGSGSGSVYITLPNSEIGCSVLICQDLWQEDPQKMSEMVDPRADILLVLNASPFYHRKDIERKQQVQRWVQQQRCPIVYCNLVGGQDELVFDGASFACNAEGSIIWQAPMFSEEQTILTIEKNAQSCPPCWIQPSTLSTLPQETEACFQALTLALQDYIRKNNFKKIVVGLSGGIDSAVTLIIASHALSAQNCLAVMMRSPYTSAISLEDAQTLAQQLQVPYQQLDITAAMQVFSATLQPILDASSGVVAENLQARIRGTLLMAIANANSDTLVLTTSNKSEISVGYGTLYGDMVGGFNVLKDLTKTQVYQLAHWLLQQDYFNVPRIIHRPPSAELRENQCDQDSLPDYAILDLIIEAFITRCQSARHALKTEEVSMHLIKKVLKMIKVSEHKRWQAAPGVKISQKAFGNGWQWPISYFYKDKDLDLYEKD